VAGHAFATAYRQWADASSRSADLADSAAFARNPEDAARLSRESDEARPAPVAHGTVQANAAASYNQDFTRAFNNPDHPCNKPGEKD
jgi:hypothetical protein